MRHLRMSPYLQRRGLSLSFRIAVPPDLRLTVGSREITKSLKTSNRILATPIALSLAAKAKQLFNELRERMGKKTQGGPSGFGYTIKLDFGDLGNVKGMVIEAEPHETDAAQAVANSIIETSARARHHHQPSPTPHALQISAPQVQRTGPVPTLKTVVDDFLAKYVKKGRPAMLKKHLQALPMLLAVVGDKPIADIKQADINYLFELLGRLPPQWAAECRRQKLTVLELADLEHEETIGPKTFDATYISCIRPFLKFARKDWQDQGFPIGLTTEGIEYIGDREEGGNKQRAFKPAELKKLFEGPEMKVFADDLKLAHFFWLPHVGLFTGARVNEICQLNPQVDIFKDSETDTWCFNITKVTEADERITKSVKTGDARKVPIHRKLLELGFLEYLERVRLAGAKLLFPDWKPINRRASGEAEKWFREFLRGIDLRDETPGLRIAGMHAFRHTLLTYGADQTPPLSLFGITGHAQGDLPIPATGAGRGYLSVAMLSPLNGKSATLDKLDYGLNFFKPVTA